MPTNWPIHRISIHATATPAGKAFTVAQIRAMHIARGWDDIGYHYLIGLGGEIGLGRKETTIPAAVHGYNKGMIAIAYVGGGDGVDTRTPAQKEAMARLVHLVATKFSVAASNIYGHRDLDWIDKNKDGKAEPDEWLKQCPCFEVSEERLGWLQRAGA